MIDIKILRTNPDLVRKALHDKVTKVDLDKVIELDIKRIPLKQKLDEIRSERNKLSDAMGKGKPDPALIEKSKALKEELQVLEAESDAVEAEFLALYKKIPNIPTADTPIGLTEDENVVVRQWGTIPTFSFPVKSHAEIAEARGWLDKERAAKVTGSRFAYLKGDLVRLQFALINWVMDTLGDREVIASIIKEHGLNVVDKPFTPVLPPFMIKTAPYDAMDRLEPREERYKIE